MGTELFIGLAVGLGIAVLAAVAVFFYARSKFGAEQGTLLERLRGMESVQAELERERQAHLGTQGNFHRLQNDLTKLNADLDAARLRHEQALEMKESQMSQRIEAEREALDREKAALMSGHEREMAALRKSLEDQKRTLEEAQEQSRLAFEAVSAKTLKSAQDELAKYAEEQLKGARQLSEADHEKRRLAIEQLVKPIQDNLKRLDDQRQQSDEKLANVTGQIGEQLKSLFGVTSNLSNALRKPQVRGSMGEDVLKTILTNSGLQEGINYTVQDLSQIDDQKLRADAVIQLPQGRKIVVDAKNLLEPYQDYVNSETEEERVRHYSRFLEAVRTQKKSLEKKAYHDQYDGPDFVVMFLPHEGMYYAAIEGDPDLFRINPDFKVVLANPMTLIAALRTISYLLDQEKLNKSAHEISELGGRIYKGLFTFAESIGKVGSGLSTAIRNYNAAIGTFEGTLVPNARKLEARGAKLGKTVFVPNQITLVERQMKDLALVTEDSTEEEIREGIEEDS